MTSVVLLYSKKLTRQAAVPRTYLALGYDVILVVEDLPNIFEVNLFSF